MHLIEPCCARKHLLALRGKLGDDGTSFFHGYGDLSLNELLPALMTRYAEVDMVLVTPSLPDSSAELVLQWLRKTWMSRDGKGRVNVIGHLTLITDLREKKSPLASKWLEANPVGERLTLKDRQQQDTAILLPDIAFFGGINLSYGEHFTAVATKNTKLIAELRGMYDKL